LSKISKQVGFLAKYWATGFVRSWPGFNPMCSPISAAGSMLVLADSALTKNLYSNWVTVSGWWRTALARLVFPIPPPPRIAILADCPPIISIIFPNSDSRPWKILGFEGNNENEFELQTTNDMRMDQTVKQAFNLFFSLPPAYT
jgi:hypothetical protein